MATTLWRPRTILLLPVAVLCACSGGNAPACRAMGGTCSSSVDCCSPLVCAAGTCQPASACRMAGGACAVTSDCCTGLACMAGRCATPPACSASGQTCATTKDCCQGLACTSGQCLAPPCQPSGQTCQADADCCTGLACTGNKCGVPPDLGIADLATADMAHPDLAMPDFAMPVPDFATPDLAPPRGSMTNPGSSCLDVLKAGASKGDGVYWIVVGNGNPFKAFCDMTTDGGGWTVCARQSFAQNGSYLGNSALTQFWGTVDATSPYGVDCVDTMRAVRPGGSVEFGLKGSTAGEWEWVWPFDTTNFYNHLKGSDDTSCDSPLLTQCKGSATAGITVSIAKHGACNNCDASCDPTHPVHRTGDSYFIYQIADAVNTNDLMEIGQGDNAHPVGIRADCGTNGWWGQCGNPGGINVAYATPDQCGSTNRVQGTVSVMFRER